MGLSAFLTPVAVRVPERRAVRACGRRRPAACASGGAASVSGGTSESGGVRAGTTQSPAAAEPVSQASDDVHPSWNVYERDGNQCVICDGTGKCKCLYCFGDGVVFIGAQRDRDAIACPQCKGRKVETCPRCHGSGVRPATRLDPLTMKIVPNITNAEVARGVQWYKGGSAEEEPAESEEKPSETPVSTAESTGPNSAEQCSEQVNSQSELSSLRR